MVLKRESDQVVTVCPEKLRTGEIDFLDKSLVVQGDVADRGKFVQVNVAIPIGFQLLNDLPEIGDLVFQFRIAEQEVFRQSSDFFKGGRLGVAEILLK